MTLYVPAEWAPHRAMWVGFPSHADLWLDDLPAAQAEVADLARALAGPGAERVRLLVCGDEAETAARALLGGVSGVEIVRGQFGDVWLRDTGPIFASRGEEEVAVGFRFNGWGGKYVMENDDLVAEQLAAAAGVPSRAAPSTGTASAPSSPRASACSVPTAIPAGTRPQRRPPWPPHWA